MNETVTVTFAREALLSFVYMLNEAGIRVGAYKILFELEEFAPGKAVLNTKLYSTEEEEVLAVPTEG